MTFTNNCDIHARRRHLDVKYKHQRDPREVNSWSSRRPEEGHTQSKTKDRAVHAYEGRFGCDYHTCLSPTQDCIFMFVVTHTVRKSRNMSRIRLDDPCTERLQRAILLYNHKDPSMKCKVRQGPQTPPNTLHLQCKDLGLPCKVR